jgi:hypothetical protein
LHICQHYQLYKDQCKEASIHENHHAIPQQLWKKKEEEEKKLKQLKIENMVEIERIPISSQFTCDRALVAIAKFIACDDQALAVVEKPVFCNCLIAMWPKTSQNDLPSTHDLVVYIHNQFVAWMKKLKEMIQVKI